MIEAILITCFSFNPQPQWIEAVEIKSRYGSYLYSKKLNLAILTNNKSTYAENVLEKFNLNKFFNTIIGFNDVTEVKPNPEGILKILDKWGIETSEAIFIGDMTTDIDAGKSANVKMVCVASGLAQKETLLNHKPDVLVNDTNELIKLFGFEN